MMSLATCTQADGMQLMAKCDEGYLCDVCAEEVEEMTDSDLYLRYILGEIPFDQLTAAPERHLRCNPVQTQFIVDDAFEPIVVEGLFDKRQLDPVDVRVREERVTRAWRRLQEVRALGISIADYPLQESA